jgi:hypothetical protein
VLPLPVILDHGGRDREVRARGLVTVGVGAGPVRLGPGGGLGGLGPGGFPLGLVSASPAARRIPM